MSESFKLQTKKRYPRIRSLISHPSYPFLIISLVLFSVIGLLAEVFHFFDQKLLQDLIVVNDGITLVLIIDLVLRWLISPSNKVFLSRN
ncbi:hypothetical protein MJH12_17385, partial [bacterium]|nr:hypothetical protein [bacterium]